MRCIAHRGFADVNPENTLPAVRAAVEAGADAVEIDVRRCGTGEVVVCHDATVDRVTDGTGTVMDLPLATLQSLDVLGTGTGIPTLAAVVEALEAEADVGLNVELKERALLEDVARVVADSPSDVLVSAFDPRALEGDEVGGTGLDTALLVGPNGVESEASGQVDGDPIEVAVDLGCAAIHPHHDRCDPSFVERAHDNGLTVNTWTVADRETAESLRAAGVDGVITDAPAACL